MISVSGHKYWQRYADEEFFMKLQTSDIQLDLLVHSSF